MTDRAISATALRARAIPTLSGRVSTHAGGRWRVVALIAVLFTCVQAASALTTDSDYWRQQIEQAEPGSQVALPAGRFKMADVKVPAGVSLSGAGYLETIIDASGGGDGLVVTGAGITVRDLSVEGAASAAVLVNAATDSTLANLRLTDGLLGLVVRGDSKAVRIENCIIANNRTGAAASGAQALVLVNNTLHNNGSLGISLSNCRDSMVFNNIISNSVTGIFVTELIDCQVDYNMYKTNFIGVMPGQTRTMTVQRMYDLAGIDRHSTQADIVYANPSEGVYMPVTPLPWARNKPTTAFRAAPALGQVAAPERDINGESRSGNLQLGAVQSPDLPVRSPIERLEILSDAGVKSAGIYTTDGILVAYLFHNMRLPKGEYPFTWPTRDWQGQPIPAGNYELRIVESDLAMRYKGLVFNNGISSRIEDHSPFSDIAQVRFAADGRVISGHHWSESHLQIRTWDKDYRSTGWHASGAANMWGMDLAGDDAVYILTEGAKDTSILARYDLQTGVPLPFSDAEPTAIVEVFNGRPHGLAILGERVYVASPDANRLFHAPLATPSFGASVEIPAPRSVVADASIKRLWVISANRDILCLDADGKEVRRQDLGFAVHQLAAAPGLLAVLSAETRKVHIYQTDATGTLTPLRTVGSGADRIGPFRTDTFTFAGDATSDSVRANIGLRADGALFVIDSPRTLFYGPDGELLRQTISVWGQHQAGGMLAGDDQPRWWNIDARYSVKMDAKADSWTPDGVWAFDQPDLPNRAMIGVFTDEGRNFGLYRLGAQGIVLIEFDGQYRGRTLVSWHRDKEQGSAWVRRTDSNGDGVIDAKDEPGTPTVLDNGKPLIFSYDARLIYPDGHKNLYIGGRVGTTGIGRLVKYQGIDAAGIPDFDWAEPDVFSAATSGGGNKFTSPYDHTTEEESTSRLGEINRFSDGTIAYTVGLKSGGGSGLGHVAGTDMAAASPDGRLRWLHTLARTEGVHGVQIEDDILVTQDFTDMDWYMMNPDGLGLGISGIPPEMHWRGMWNDHPEQYRLYKGNDGKIYAILGDYMLTAYHHFVLDGTDTIQTHRKALALTTDVDPLLAQAPNYPIPAKVEAPTFRITIKRLDAPLAIDGDLAKWRTAGVTPQIIVTPEAASGDISGPEDLSGVVRLAHENGNLYVQVLKFDDIVTMHQPLEKHYKQDSVEMCINSFLQGFKFNVTRTREHGDTIFRDRFYVKNLNKVYPREEAPLVIKVLDDASTVEERALIESIYGVDLSGCKVIVTEFMIPLEKAFEGDPKAGVKGRSGDQMWIGFMLDDNDQPGSDTQDLVVWPATYGTFALKEKSALATFE